MGNKSVNYIDANTICLEHAQLCSKHTVHSLNITLKQNKILLRERGSFVKKWTCLLGTIQNLHNHKCIFSIGI